MDWFEFIDLPQLQSIKFGYKSFNRVHTVVFESDRMDGLGELESVVIGKESFTYAKTKKDIWNSKRTDGSCRIVNCPTLKFIKTAYEAFEDYHSFELNNLLSLQSIDIDIECFEYAPSFSLTGLIDGLV